MATATAAQPRPVLSFDLVSWLPRLLLAWLVLRTFLWSLSAVLTQPNAPLDALELLYLGRDWQLGYAKHPPLTAWLAEIARWLTPGSLFGVYLLSYGLLGFAQWCAWRLANEVTTPARAALATLCLEGLVYFTHRGSEFNNNITLLAFWAWAILACYLALKYHRPRAWLGLGLALGLGLLSKYALVLLLPFLLAVFVCEPAGRRCWCQSGLYLTAGVVLLVIAPHAWWVVQHGFPGLQWALERAELGAGQGDRFQQAAVLLGSQLVRLLPAVLVLVPLVRWGSSPLSPLGRGVGGEGRKTTFDLRYLLYVVAGPILLHLLLPLLTGRNVRDTWMVHLWTYLGVLLVLLLPLRDDAAAWQRTVVVWALVAGGFLIGSASFNLFAPEWRGKPGRIHFAGAELARVVEQRWREEMGRPLPLLGGDGWLCGNVSHYGRDRARVLHVRELDYDARHPRFSANLWRAPAELARYTLEDVKLHESGGVLLWNASEFGDELPLLLRQRYPTAEVRPALMLPWQCQTRAEPARVGMAVVRGGHFGERGASAP